jgi:AcrR family transcriptional regulator
MGHRHDRAEILAAAVTVARTEGLHRCTYGRVGRAAGASDRMVAYYFPTVGALVEAVLLDLGLRLQALLAPAVAAPRADHRALLRTLWPRLADPEVDWVFALYFEAVGLAAADRAPYRDVVPVLVEAWIDWAADRLTGPRPRRRAEAEATVAAADGLLLLRRIAGAEAAERAARRLGVA